MSMSKKLTLKKQILDFVTPGGRESYGHTNWNLSHVLNAPEPSVRRATRQLVEAGQLRETTARGTDKRYTIA